MLRGQTVWSGGSLTALASPHLADQPSDAAFSLDLGATNRQDRWLLALSHQLSESISPQWLLLPSLNNSSARLVSTLKPAST